MATIYSYQDRNIRRTWGLMALFLIIVVGVGWGISYIYNDATILYVAVLFSVFMNVLAYWFSDKIVLKMNGAKPATLEENRELYNIVENLSITAGLPMPKLFIINDPAPNAFATGRDQEHAVVAVTTGLLQILDRTELEGVIAHELSHIGNRDMLISTVVVVLVGFISIISDFFVRASIYGAHRDSDSGGRSGGLAIVLGVILAILAPIAAGLIQFAISRRREFLADASGALLTRYPAGLASALAKISQYNMPMRKANDATAHLFIANPFGAVKTRGMHKLFMTHPPVEERIAALREMGSEGRE